MNRWQAIVFDLDDTLYAERDYVLSGFKAVSVWAESHLQLPAAQSYAELQTLFEQQVRGDTFNRWLVAHDLNPATVVPDLVRVYREHEPTLTAFPEVPDLLETLRRGCRLGLLSDGYLDVQRRKLEALVLASHFDAIVFSDELGREGWKPSPRPYQLVLERLGVEARHAIYIADNPAKDFLGARRAGMASVWVRRPHGEYTKHEPITPEHAPHVTITSLGELKNTLEMLSNKLT